MVRKNNTKAENKLLIAIEAMAAAKGSEGELRQVLLSIIVNAADAMVSR